MTAYVVFVRETVTDCQAARLHRLQGSTGRVYFVEGIDAQPESRG
ncbi:hypothetical protein [Azomonas macrocytogenes]|uniref:Uncharacterized protein n=1 Tax=Azomonas macrocytogenes TaxID=69962 RepID=A0A839T4E2_AZOMA|nr:hypothetical protein [Azomonas macrocytogenes]MBB3104407.1 hypothetical protein [Azomonas macrocytogenes]